MQLRGDVVELTNQIVADCGLDTSSIFFYDESEGRPALSYLYHVNVSAEAQHRYAHGRIFESDPFTRSLLLNGEVGAGRFVRWGDRRLDALADDAPDYRAFLAQHDIDVVGALTRRLTSRLCMVIGMHRGRRAARRGAVACEQLAHRLETLSDLVVGQLFAELMEHDDAYGAFRAMLDDGDSAPVAGAGLSPRETQIAHLVSAGKQNKEVAWLLGLSQFTVENHLRRIYRKLQVHNRAGLVGRMARGRH